MKHKLLSLFFASIVAMNMYAADVWDGSSDIFTHGAGTEQSPYLVENAEQLAFIAEMVNAGVYTYAGNYFKLTTDLDLNDLAWTPIGDATHKFGGNFDGDGHTISKLKVTSAANAGLFGVVDGGIFKNLIISGSIASSGNAGGIAGKAISSAQFYQCKNKSSINGKVSGGVVGLGDLVTIKNCINEGSINATLCSGGIIGQCDNRIVLEGCYNYGSISVTGVTSQKSTQETREGSFDGGGNPRTYRDITLFAQGFAGGIIGQVNNVAQCDSCYNFGTVNADISRSPYTDVSYNYRYYWAGYGWAYYYYRYLVQSYCMFGGIAGYFQNGSMINCSNQGVLDGSPNASVTAPYWVNDYAPERGTEGNVRVLAMDFDRHLMGGGIIGAAWNASISHCFNIGNHTNSDGQLIGGNYNWNNKSNSKSINISYCYDLRESVTSSYSSSLASYRNSYIVFSGEDKGYYNSSNAYVSRTDAQMKSVTLPILLNADSTVFIQDVKPYVNKGYPIFKKGMKYVATNEASDVSYTSATIQGNYYNCNPTSMGFEYKEDTATNYVSQTVSNASPAQYELTNLTQGTSYVARYWLIDDGIKYFGDTIHFTTLACPTDPVRSDTVKLCDGESYDFAGKTLTKAGVYHDSLVATTGCDSVIELVLQVYDTYKYERFDTINRGESYDFYGQPLTETGIYNEYVRTTERCNWVQLHLRVIEPNQTLTLNVNNPQWGSVIGAGDYEQGTLVEFSAIPSTECYFVNWSDGETSATRTIILSKDTSITANFAINQYTITTQAEHGSVANGGTYPYGSQVILTANADEHYHFVRWSDGNLDASRQITITEDKTYTAIFEKDQFLIVFKDDDETELKRDSVEYGVMPEAPTNPTKPATAQYTYTFAGWTPEIVFVTSDAEYTATFDSIVNKYTITFKNGDHELQSTEIEYGQMPAYNGVTPTKPADAQYTYTFAGWSPEVAAVTGDTTYTAVFNATINKYTITFKNENEVLQSTEIDYGIVPSYNGVAPTKPATAQYTYTFAGWTPEIVSVTSDAVYTATFDSIVNKYTIIFKNGDQELQSTEIEYGQMPAYNGVTPTKPADAQYTYTFAGWSPEVAAVTGDTTYTAVFNTTINKYTITFKNENEVLQSTEIDYGIVPSYNGVAPTKASTAQYTYTFAGWTPEVVSVTSDAVYTATFDSIVNKYTITFKNGDHELQSTEIEYGQMPAYNGVTPTKPADAQFTYTFAGWSPEVVTVTGDATYNAIFNATKNSYTITWLNDDGSLIDQTTVEYGVLPTHDDPVKENTAEYTYTFTGWTPNVVTVTSDAIYQATFSSTKNKYLIIFRNDDGTELQRSEVEYGTLPIAPTNPTKESTAQYDYTFNGWAPAVVVVTQAATYTATYTSSLRSYLVTFINDDNSIISMQSYKYGEFPTLPATPTKTATVEFSYTFAGWTPSVVVVTGDATYRATYNSTKRSYTITWLNDDGSLIDQTTVEYGVVPTHADPVKANTAEYTYMFAGWTPEIVAVTGDATYRATFNAAKNSYTITWLNEDGSLIDQTTVEYGVVPTHADPVKENTAEYTYTFAGWTPEIVAVTGDATYRATFNSVVNVYTITVNAINGEIEGAGEYAYGTEIELKAIPTSGYKFDQWSDGVKDNPRTIIVTGDAEYTAIFIQSQGINDVYISDPARKVIIDDKIFILRGEKVYTVTGQEVR